jgi:hypothetical protein
MRYMLLNPGEAIAEGDESRDHWGMWQKLAPEHFGTVVIPSWNIRRPLPPCQCEALEAAISIETAEKQAAHSEKAAVERRCEELRKQVKLLKARLNEGQISDEEHSAIINEINPLGQEF